MNNHSTSADGLRERKRAVTQAGMERVAVALAIEHGYEIVTVDMICEASMVSQRTFFNYFGSKEGVILGPTPPAPSEEATERFIHSRGTDVLSDFVTMIAGLAEGIESDADLFRARRRLIQSTPELFAKEMARMGEMESYFASIVLARLRAAGRDTAAEPDLADQAHMIIALASGVMHYTMRKWFETDQLTEPQELLSASIGLIRRITGSAE